MLKKITIFCVLVCASAAHAVPISFVPSNQSVLLGGMASVDVVVSELGNGLAPSLGGFDLNVLFDSSIISLNSVTFGDGLGDELFFEAQYFDTPGAGDVNLFGLSFLFDFELDALQTDTVLLATLIFDTLQVGVSALSVANVILSDAFGDEIALTNNPAGLITVTTAPTRVPEPGSSSLMVFSLGLLVWLRRRMARPVRQRKGFEAIG